MGGPTRHARHPGRAGTDPARPGPDLSRPLPGAVASPNIWRHTETYEIENRAADPDGRLWSTLAEIGPWVGRTVLDLGCGTGFHLPLFAGVFSPVRAGKDGTEKRLSKPLRVRDEPVSGRSKPSRVIGVEPHPDLVALARRRTNGMANVRVLPGTAQAIPLPDSSVDVVHVRWAYFFGPGCEPGLPELARVVRPGGVAMIVDNDGSRSTFGAWFRRGYPHLPPPAEIERFWTTRGWTRTPVDMGWRFESRADLEAVVRIELRPEVADDVLSHHAGLDVDYAVLVWSLTF